MRPNSSKRNSNKKTPSRTTALAGDTQSAAELKAKTSPIKVNPVIAVSELETKKNWIELVPSGIMVLPGSARPVFLLKHEGSGESLPVWMHPLDGSVGLHELSSGAEGSPHRVVRELLKHWGIGEVSCYFDERIGHHQYARLKFSSAHEGSDTFEIRCRADEVMSFCLANKTKFYSTFEFIAQCRVLNEDIEKLQEGLLTGAAQEAFPELEMGSKKTGYVM